MRREWRAPGHFGGDVFHAGDHREAIVALGPGSPVGLTIPGSTRDVRAVPCSLDARLGGSNVHPRGIRALAASEQGLALARRAGDNDQIVPPLNNLAMRYLRFERYDDAVAACREALALARSLAFQNVEPLMWDSLGQALPASGEYDEAIDAYPQVARHYARAWRPLEESIALSNLGTRCAPAGHPDEAAVHWRQVLPVMDENAIADGHEVSRIDLLARLADLRTGSKTP